MPTSSLHQAAGRFVRFAAPLSRSLILLAAPLLLTACGNGSLFPPGLGGSGKPPTDPATGNFGPSISGKPQTVAPVNRLYSFRPDAYDPDSDVLVFQVNRLPTWARFNAANGEITGIPPTGSTGTFTDIRITVTDGALKTALPAFSITVTDPAATTPGPATGKATLSWTVPTQNEDGSPLKDLAGYRIYYGTVAADLSQRVEITNPSTATVEIPGLQPGTWYFAMTTVSAAGVESRRTGVVAFTL